MKDSVLLVLIVLMKALVSFTEDDVSHLISCNTELLNWQEAVENCKSKGGDMLPFETGLGQNLDQLHLKREIDVWTADYLTQPHNDVVQGTGKYCGFNYLNKTSRRKAEVFYGDCDAIRNSFCLSSGRLVVHKTTRENVKCNYIISNINHYSSQIDPGFYWTSEYLYGIPVKGTKGSTGSFCGAYRSSIGWYFANCTGRHFSLCYSSGKEAMNTACFNGKTTKDQTTFMTRTDTPFTNRSKLTASIFVTSNRQHQTASTSAENNTFRKTIHAPKEHDNSDTGIGLNVGVPIGIIVPLVCGSLIIMYIYRKRIKCWQSSNSKQENRRKNQFHTQETLPVHGQLNVYSESIQPSERRTNENNLTDISAQYAVVRKPKIGDSKSRKDNTSNKSYQNATNDEYDVAGRFQNSKSYPSDNLYNHFESADEYNSTSFVREEEECNNLYNTTGDRNLVESDYDSTIQVNSTALPDDVYNHLS